MSSADGGRRRGVDAVETAGAVLAAILREGGSARLKRIAERSGISPPKVHRYLVSLVACGLVQKDRDGIGYRFGLLARGIGLSASADGDLVEAVAPAVLAFSEEHGLTCGIARFAAGEVRVQRWIVPSRDFAITPRPGAAHRMEITSSVTGRLFGAFLPAAIVRPLAEAELAAEGGTARPDALARAERDFAAIRAAGLASGAGPRVPGINALGVPVLGPSGAILVGLTLIGHESHVAADPGTPLARAFRDLAERLGRFLGARPESDGSG